MDPAAATALLARAPYVHLATTTPEGAPVLRALDFVLVDGAVCFHGARAGEKARCAGRPAVVSAEELVAHVPSWMRGTDLASAAGTLYRSVQVHGTLVEVTEPAERARILAALVRRWQPEGRHAPVDAADARYRGDLAATLVLRVPLDRVDGKLKLGQHLAAGAVRDLVAGLWERGAPGDAEAIEAVRGASPRAPDPAFLAADGGVRLHVALGADEVPGVVRLLAGTYWWADGRIEEAGPAHLASQAWVGAKDAAGALVASARATSDGRRAWIYDVVVDPAWRGRGLGLRLSALLLDHPAVRRAGAVRLRTRDAQGLYAKLGFRPLAEVRTAQPSTEMILVRPAGA